MAGGRRRQAQTKSAGKAWEPEIDVDRVHHPDFGGGAGLDRPPIDVDTSPAPTDILSDEEGRIDGSPHWSPSPPRTPDRHIDIVDELFAEPTTEVEPPQVTPPEPPKPPEPPTSPKPVDPEDDRRGGFWDLHFDELDWPVDVADDTKVEDDVSFMLIDYRIYYFQHSVCSCALVINRFPYINMYSVLKRSGFVVTSML